jgi:hypothetical protein
MRRKGVRSRCLQIEPHEVVGEVLKLATLFFRPAQSFSDIAVSLRGGRGLKSRQRDFLLRDFRLELESAVEDAE